MLQISTRIATAKSLKRRKHGGKVTRMLLKPEIVDMCHIDRSREAHQTMSSMRPLHNTPAKRRVDGQGKQLGDDIKQAIRPIFGALKLNCQSSPARYTDGCLDTPGYAREINARFPCMCE